MRSPPAVDHAFRLPVGFLRLYNLSIAQGDVPGGAGQPDDAASTLPISQATDVVVANNGECVADRERLTGLQDWIGAQEAVTK